MTISARQARLNKRMTIKKVSKLTGLSEPFIAAIERGERDVSAEGAHALCDLYGVPEEEIFLPSRYTVRKVAENRFDDSA